MHDHTVFDQLSRTIQILISYMHDHTVFDQLYLWQYRAKSTVSLTTKSFIRYQLTNRKSRACVRHSIVKAKQRFECDDRLLVCVNSVNKASESQVRQAAPWTVLSISGERTVTWIYSESSTDCHQGWVAAAPTASSLRCRHCVWCERGICWDPPLQYSSKYKVIARKQA